MSFTAVALSLSLTYVPLLSPEAVELNMKAMSFYDAGQFSPAVDGFHAAYQSMPDARRDKAGRQMLLGSMAMTLRQLHEQTGEAAPVGLATVASAHRRDLNAGQALHAALATRPATQADRTRMHELVAATRREPPRGDNDPIQTL